MIAIVIAFVIFIPMAIMANGWLIYTLWGWLIVATLHLPELTIAQAIGLSLMYEVFRGVKSSPFESAEEKEAKKNMSFLKAISPLMLQVAWFFMALLIGFIVKHYLPVAT